MNDLLPCPFCGKAVARIGRTPLMNDISGWHINCSAVAGGCNMEGPWRGTRAEAIAAWNTRQPAPSGNGEAVPAVVKLALDQEGRVKERPIIIFI